MFVFSTGVPTMSNYAYAISDKASPKAQKGQSNAAAKQARNAARKAAKGNVIPVPTPVPGPIVIVGTGSGGSNGGGSGSSNGGGSGGSNGGGSVISRSDSSNVTIPNQIYNIKMTSSADFSVNISSAEGLASLAPAAGGDEEIVDVFGNGMLYLARKLNDGSARNIHELDNGDVELGM